MLVCMSFSWIQQKVTHIKYQTRHSTKTSSFDCDDIIGVTRCGGCCWPARCQSPLAIHQKLDIIRALQQQVSAFMSGLAGRMLLLIAKTQEKHAAAHS